MEGCMYSFSVILNRTVSINLIHFTPFEGAVLLVLAGDPTNGMLKDNINTTVENHMTGGHYLDSPRQTLSGLIMGLSKLLHHIWGWELLSFNQFLIKFLPAILCRYMYRLSYEPFMNELMLCWEESHKSWLVILDTYIRLQKTVKLTVLKILRTGWDYLSGIQSSSNTCLTVPC